MRDFRRLPPLLRVASILGLLFSLAPIAAIMVVLIASLSSSPQSGVYATRVAVIVGNLGVLSGACSVAVQTYSTRFRQPDRGPLPLASWQSRMRAIFLAAALPICALALAVFIPPTQSAFEIVFPVSIIGAVVLLAASLWMNIGRQAVD